MNIRYTLLFSLVAGLAACANPSEQSAPDQAAASPSQTQTPPAQAAADEPKDEQLVIEFDEGSSTLSTTAMRQLDGAARLYRDARPEVMIVTGHADKTGQEYPNLLLSAQRAWAVNQGLVARGLPSNRLQVVADGESERVPGTGPGKKAVVTWR